MSLEDLRCDRCRINIAACGHVPGDGYAYCGRECAALGPAPVVIDGQLELFEVAS